MQIQAEKNKFDVFFTRENFNYLLLVIFSVVTCIAGVIRAFKGDEEYHLDNITLLYFGGAGVMLLLQKVEALSFGDYKVEFKKTREIASEAREIAQKAQSATFLGIGKRSSSITQNMFLDVNIQPGTVVDDPWKGQFGGKSIDNGRELTATVARLSNTPEYFSIHLIVRSVDPRKPLLDMAQFFIHDTFKNDKPVVRVDSSGVAKLNLIAWGSFTVGALADNGNTKLELDLSALPNAPREFCSR